MLLHIVKGARSYSEIQTVGGTRYQTFRDACDTLGLLGDDHEWSHAMADAARWALPYQLRQLFVTLLLFCQVANPTKLFDDHIHAMGDDIRYDTSQLTAGISLPQIELHIKSYVLLELQRLLNNIGHALGHFGLPQPDHHASSILENNLILDDLTYASDDKLQKATEQLSKLNDTQKTIYHIIDQSVQNNYGQTFFVFGFGGTGKAFLWTILLNNIRARGKIALAVASSGIAALLLPGGRTPHSRFRIPLDVQEHFMCAIKKNTKLSALIEQMSLIIWDEAPVNHKHLFEALDRTLKTNILEV